MRILFSALGLLIVVLIIGVLTKKQLAAVAPAPAATVRVQGLTVPASPQAAASDIRKSVDAIMQQQRPMPEDK